MDSVGTGDRGEIERGEVAAVEMAGKATVHGSTDRAGRAQSTACHYGDRIDFMAMRRRDGAADFMVRVHGGVDMPASVVEQFEIACPTLKEHLCTSDIIDAGNPNAAPMSIPHFIEHVAIDLLVWAYRDQGLGFAGYTVWLDRKGQVARITLKSVEFEITERAFQLACQVVGEALQPLRH